MPSSRHTSRFAQGVVLVLIAAGLASLAMPGCSATCGPSNCFGCCSADNMCVAASASACGADGAVCTACSGFDICMAGQCVPAQQQSTGPTSGPATTGTAGSTGAATLGSSGMGTSGGATTGNTTTTPVTVIGATSTSGNPITATSTSGNPVTATTTTGSPVTATSTSGNPATATVGTSGTTGTSMPVIQSLSADPSTIGPGGSSTISAIVTDSAGLNDLAGGTLLDGVTGGTYGAFSTPGGQGTFTYTLSWTAIDQMQSIANLPAGGGSRSLLAEFFDNAGHTVSQSLTLGLACPTASNGVCNDECVDLQSDPNNCGSCGTMVATGGICDGGTPGCPSAYDVVCEGACTNTRYSGTDCGTCGNNCTTWADNNGLASEISGVACDYGTCSYSGVLETDESCQTWCAAQGTGLSCYLNVSCNYGDGGYTGYTNAGCGEYEGDAETCEEEVALGCSDIPPSTIAVCDGVPTTATFELSTCECQ